MEKSLTSACTPRGRVWVSHGLLLLSPISVYQPSIEVANKLCWTRVALRLLLVSAINSDGADPRSLTRVYTVVKACGPAAILSYSLHLVPLSERYRTYSPGQVREMSSLYGEFSDDLRSVTWPTYD